MKYIKYFALAIGFFGLVACSDDKKDFNTSSDVMVELPKTEITSKENRGIFNVPVEVTGSPNGVVTVTVKVEATGESPAHEATLVNGNREGNFIITSKTINIPADKKTANVQINAIDDDEINVDRTFIVTIEKAEGAKIDEAKNRTLVTIKDEDFNPYEKLQGNWIMSWNDIFEGVILEFPVTIEGYGDDSPAYNKILKIEGLLTNPPYIYKGSDKDDSLPLKMKYFFDEDSNVVTLEIAYDQQIGKMNGAALPDYADLPVYFIGLVEYPDGFDVNEGYIEGEASEDRKVIQFNPDDLIAIFVEDAGLFFAGYELTLTRN